MRDLVRQKIKGISFRRRTFQGGNRKKFDVTLPPVEDVDLQEAAPTDFSSRDVKRLLKDLGRQELHTLVSDCVEHTSHWHQLRRHVEKFETTYKIDEENLPKASHAQLRAIEVRYLHRKWLHRLRLLELIADAQASIQHEHLMRGPL